MWGFTVEKGLFFDYMVVVWSVIKEKWGDKKTEDNPTEEDGGWKKSDGDNKWGVDSPDASG